MTPIWRASLPTIAWRVMRLGCGLFIFWLSGWNTYVAIAWVMASFLAGDPDE